ncbi:MAG: hypothetical protein OEV91_02885 [Desulfobulbaceae bacterium]|nr:hypothetical protein [Desulfobulbaceae bacterium]
MKTYLYLINNFAHDLFTGIWCGSFVGLYTVRAKSRFMPPEAAAFMADLRQHFFWLGAAALMLVMLTGCIRFLYRREWDATEEPTQFKKPVLIIKHALLGSAFLAGSAYAFLWTF